MKLFLGFIATIVVIGIVAATVAISYNVAASTPEAALVSEIIHSVMRHSVEARAGAEGRETWTDAELRKGFEEYNEMCAICHTAPGKERTPISKGMRPQPPNLSETSKQWTTAQLFWIIKNGVKMTGMPAFGSTHKDDEIWNIVGFIRHLPQISAEKFRAFENQGGASKHEEEAHHNRL